jgi:hypothetical protein
MNFFKRFSRKSINSSKPLCSVTIEVYSSIWGLGNTAQKEKLICRVPRTGYLTINQDTELEDLRRKHNLQEIKFPTEYSLYYFIKNIDLNDHEVNHINLTNTAPYFENVFLQFKDHESFEYAKNIKEYKHR